MDVTWERQKIDGEESLEREREREKERERFKENIMQDSIVRYW